MYKHNLHKPHKPQWLNLLDLSIRNQYNHNNITEEPIFNSEEFNISATLLKNILKSLWDITPYGIKQPDQHEVNAENIILVWNCDTRPTYQLKLFLKGNSFFFTEGTKVLDCFKQLDATYLSTTSISL